MAIQLTEAQIELIAERAADKAIEKVYAQVGAGVLKRLAWFVGSAVIALLVWLGSKGMSV